MVSGDNVKLKLKGVEDNDILPGFVLCSPDAVCHVGRVFDAEVRFLFIFRFSKILDFFFKFCELFFFYSL